MSEQRNLVPRRATPAEAAAWHGELIALGPNRRRVGKDLPDVVVTTDDSDQPVYAIPFTLDEITLADLAAGKPLWLLSWGGVMPFCLTTDAPPHTR